MGWKILFCCLPLVPLLALEQAMIFASREKNPGVLEPTAGGPYRDSPAPVLPAPSPYAKGWQHFRRLRLLFLLCFVYIGIAMPLMSKLATWTGVHADQQAEPAPARFDPP